MNTLAAEKIKAIDKFIGQNIEILVDLEYGVITEDAKIKAGIITPQNAQLMENSKKTRERYAEQVKETEEKIVRLQTLKKRYEDELKK